MRRTHCEPDGRRGNLTGFSLFENRDRGEVAGAAQPAAKSGNALLECLDLALRDKSQAENLRSALDGKMG